MATFTSEGPNPLNFAERATCTLNFSDDVLLGIVEAVCFLDGYQPQVDNLDYDENVEGSERYIPNPQGPGEFVMQQIKQWGMAKREQYLQFLAQQQVAQTLQSEASSISITSEVIP